MEDLNIKLQIPDASGVCTAFFIEEDDELLIAVTLKDDPNENLFVIADTDIWIACARKPSFMSPGGIVFFDMDENVIKVKSENNPDMSIEMSIYMKWKDRKLYEEAVSLLLDYDVDVRFV